MVPGTYRDPEEARKALERDPIKRTRLQLEAAGLGAQAAQVEAEARAEIDAALAAAEASPVPEVHEAYQDIVTTGAGVWA